MRFPRSIAAILLVSMSQTLSSCNKSEPTPAPLAELPPGPTKPVPDVDKDEDPLLYRWYYKGSSEEQQVAAANLEICPDDFEVDGLCKTPLSLCKRKISLYACYPEDLQIRITGRVVDENNNPIGGVKISSSLGYGGYSDLATTKTKENGTFVLKNINACYPLISAFKDGYFAMDDRHQMTLLSKCKTEQFSGATGLVFQLKKSSRTVPSTMKPISTENDCKVIGRVLDKNGQSIAGVIVNDGSATAISNDEGIYVIEKNQKCNNFCMAYKEGYVNYSPQQEGSSAIVSCFNGSPADIVLVKK